MDQASKLALVQKFLDFADIMKMDIYQNIFTVSKQHSLGVHDNTISLAEDDEGFHDHQCGAKAVHWKE